MKNKFNFQTEFESVTCWLLEQIKNEPDSEKRNSLEWQKEVGFMALTKLAYRHFQFSESQERSTGLIKIPVEHAAPLYLYEAKGIPFHSTLNLSEREVFSLLRHELTETASDIFFTHRELFKAHFGQFLDVYYFDEACKKE